MRYYKKDNKDGTVELLISTIAKNSQELKEITEDEFNLLFEEKNTPTESDLIAQIKTAIENAVLTIRVEVDGFAFDGNETATTRMSKAVAIMKDTESQEWKLYDNSKKIATKAELAEALRTASILLGKLWFCESIEEVEQIVSQDSVWLEKYNGL